MPHASAAGPQPLVVHRREARSRGEADAQRRQLLTCEGVPRPPRGSHLGGVVDDGHPPAGDRAGWTHLGRRGTGVGGPGVDEQGQVRLLQRRQKWPECQEALGPAHPGGWHLQSRCAALEQGGQLASRGSTVAQGRLAREDRPPAEAGIGAGDILESCDTLVVGVQQRLALRARQVLDTQGRGVAEHRCHRLAPEPLRPKRRVVVGGVEVRWGLAGQVQCPPVEAGRLPSSSQRGQERLRPQVLVDVQCRFDGEPSVRAQGPGAAKL